MPGSLAARDGLFDLEGVFFGATGPFRPCILLTLSSSVRAFGEKSGSSSNVGVEGQKE